MSTLKWIACVDLTDGCDRESWSAFYMNFFVGETEEEAQYFADYFIAHWMNKALDEDGELPEWDFGSHVTGESEPA